MKGDGAKRYVVLSALVVAGMWAYRKYQKKDLTGAIADGPTFLTAWGAVYFTLGVLSEPAPRFAGSMAILIMVADVLVNGEELAKGIQASTSNTSKPAPATPTKTKTASKPPAGHGFTG